MKINNTVGPTDLVELGKRTNISENFLYSLHNKICKKQTNENFNITKQFKLKPIHSNTLITIIDQYRTVLRVHSRKIILGYPKKFLLENAFQTKVIVRNMGVHLAPFNAL